MKFLIIGSGGIGGSIGGYLAASGNDVTFIARGAHLEAMNKCGLKINSGTRGEIILSRVHAYDSKDYGEKADVIFVCVKSYSLDEIIPLLKRCTNEDTIVIPILNGINNGDKIYDKVKKAIVLDGCVYLSAYIEEPGEITHMGNLFRLVFGPRTCQKVNSGRLEAIKEILEASGIQTVLSNDIKRDTFRKFTFISAFAACGVYYSITSSEFKIDEYRNTYISLLEEIKALSEAMGINIENDIVKQNLMIADALLPGTTASLQKDLAAGKETEIDGLIFEVVRLAEKYNVKSPNYRKVAEKFGYK